MKNKLQIFSLLIAMASMAIFVSCGDDDEGPLPPKARISLDVNDNITLERGSSVTVNLTVTAEGGLTSLTANNDAVSFTEGTSDDEFLAVYQYSSAATDAVGDVTVDFEATDGRGQLTTKTLTITVVGQQIVLSTDITSDMTLDPDNSYTLEDSIDVENATLTIPAGTIIRAKVFDKIQGGDTYVKVAGITVQPTATIIINGTAADPVVFTPDTSNPEAGMWAGLEIKGGSGHVLNYVRIEYGGTEQGDPTATKPSLYFDDNVGTSTVDYVQVHNPLEIGIRCDGGSVNLKHIVVTNALSSALRFDDSDTESYSGNVQFAVLNNPQGNHGSRAIRVRDGASVTFANVTGVGSGNTFEDPDEPGSLSSFDFARFESSHGGYGFYNIIAAEYPEDGIRAQVYVEGDTIAHSYIFKIGGFGDDGIIPDGQTEGTTALRQAATRFAGNDGINIDADNTLIAGIGINDFVPDAAQTSPYNSGDLGAFFDDASYVGAVENAAGDWTLGWTLNVDGSERQ
ncbi:MAG: hypothetical protein KI790_09035 [Cyclobacteriaceae bacterium]|nr:hypothetical protein [Cyclobacteriaceae bacterium HetDA_MAG_MS6]